MDKNCIGIMKNVSKIKSISNIYTTCFEAGFLERAENFYKQKLHSIEPEPVLEYLKIVTLLIKLTNSTL